MSDWRSTARQQAQETGYDREAIGTGNLSEGDRVVMTFEDDGEEFDGEYGPTVRFEVEVEDASDLADTEVEDGDPAVWITSSTRFLFALDEAVGGEDLTDRTIEVIRTGDGYDTDYAVDEVDET